MGPVAVNMLVFSFGLAGLLAPPVTSAAYTADSMAGSWLSCTGWQAMNSSTLLYILPFIFVYKNGLLFADKPTDMIISVLLATGIGISVDHRVMGCICFRPIVWRQRSIFLASALLVVVPNSRAALCGSLLFALAFLLGIWLARRKRKHLRYSNCS